MHLRVPLPQLIGVTNLRNVGFKQVRNMHVTCISCFVRSCSASRAETSCDA